MLGSALVALVERSRDRTGHRRRKRTGSIWLVILLLAGLLAAAPSIGAQSSEWSTYLYDLARDNAVQDGRTLASRPIHLTQAWSFLTHGAVVASPVVANGRVYVPSWDGTLYAINLATHAADWQTYLGSISACGRDNYGISSSPTWAPEIGPNGAILIGGGGQVQSADQHLYFYALDAVTGKVLWQTPVGDATRDALYDAPLYTGGRVYIGTAGLPECGLRAGAVYELDPRTGEVLHKVSMVGPKGQGGAVWGSISLDSAGNRLFVPTGDGKKPRRQPLTEGVVALDPDTLRVLDHWQVPPRKQRPDDDFGTTPTVFTTLLGRRLVGAAIKNGEYYAWDASNLAAGPVWKQRLGASGSCQGCDTADISSSAFASGAIYPGGGVIYVAGQNVTIGGQRAAGALEAIDPATGRVLWRVKCAGHVVGAVTVYNDTVIVAAGTALEQRSASDGHLLASQEAGSLLYASPVVVDGTVYVGSMDGEFHAISIAAGSGSDSKSSVAGHWDGQW